MGGGFSVVDSVRLYMLSKLAGASTNMFDLPQSYVLPYTNIPECFEAGGLSEWAAATGVEIMKQLSGFDNEHIFVRPCPIDEFYYPQLSFAGVYKSYKPRREKKLYDNLNDGLIKVLQGRYSDYADYYYHRHGINRNRQVSIMCTAQIEDASMYGTAYVYQGKCVYELFDTPLAMYTNDPLRIADDGAGKGLAGQIAFCMREAERIAGVPVDIEFTLTRRERICITEIRPISKTHLEQWAKLDESTWASAIHGGPSSNVLNTIGHIAGPAVDLRKRKLRSDDVGLAKEAIFIVTHQSGNGVSSEDILFWLDKYDLYGIRLIVDHGQVRINNHLQYIMMEDPGIRFVAHTLNVPEVPEGCVLCVDSDGFNVNMRIE